MGILMCSLGEPTTRGGDDMKIQVIKVDGVYYKLVEEDKGCDVCHFKEKQGNWCNKLISKTRSEEHRSELQSH